MYPNAAVAPSFENTTWVPCDLKYIRLVFWFSIGVQFHDLRGEEHIAVARQGSQEMVHKAQ